MRLAALCCAGVALAPAVVSAAVPDAPTRILIAGSETHELLELAAKEVRRYAYATTGAFPTIDRSGDGLVAEGGAAASTVVLATARDAQLLMGSSEGEGDRRLRSVSASVLAGGPDAHARERLDSGATLLIGATPLSVLYAAYEYAATDLGVYFAIDGDRIPRRSARAAPPSGPSGPPGSSSSQPRFASRGAVP